MRIRKKTKRLMALLLTLLMLHASLPIEALAQATLPLSDVDPGTDPVTTDPGDDKPGDDDPGDDKPTEPGEDGLSAATAASFGDPGESSAPTASAPDVAGMSGAASYSIPVKTAPGRAGIVPNLGITYISSRRNGWLGAGFDLNTGSIQRNTKRGLDYADNDFVASINGSTSELVDRSNDWGPGCYGSKIEGVFMKFCLDQGNEGWIVTAKDGTQYHYGTTLASRQGINPQMIAGTFKWRLHQVKDINGNYMMVYYTPEDQYGEMYLQGIEYTGNGGLSPSNLVKFVLDSTRTDHIISYASQIKVETVQRLKTIEVHGNGELAWRYELDYDYSPSSGRSLLQSVVQVGGDGTSLPPVTFEWKEGDTKTFPETYEDWGDRQQYYAGEESCLQMADVNGDGRSDQMTATPFPPPSLPTKATECRQASMFTPAPA